LFRSFLRQRAERSGHGRAALGRSSASFSAASTADCDFSEFFNVFKCC